MLKKEVFDKILNIYKNKNILREMDFEKKDKNNVFSVLVDLSHPDFITLYKNISNKKTKLAPLILTFEVKKTELLISGKSEIISVTNKKENIFEDYDHRDYYFLNDLSQSLALNDAFFSLGENYVLFNYKGIFQV